MKQFHSSVLAGCAGLVWLLFLTGSLYPSFGQEPMAPPQEKGSSPSQIHDQNVVPDGSDTEISAESDDSAPGPEGEETVRRRRVLKRVGPQSLTKEQQEEAERLSAIAARMGTDPTAIIGRAQTLFRYDALPGGSRASNLVARVDVPYRGDFLLRADVPYVWRDPNRPDVSSENGLSDLFVRTGARLYAVPGYAFFAGMDFTFPTADNRQLGSGKYSIGPALATARVFPELDSFLFGLLQHQFSVGGDPSRQEISTSRFGLIFNTIWTNKWWTQVEAVTQVDWERKTKNSMTLEFEGGHRFTKDWGIWVRPGIGLWGRDVPGAYDWNIEVGIRRMFAGF